MVAGIETIVMEFQPISFDGIAERNFANVQDWQCGGIYYLIFRDRIVKGFNFPVLIVEDDLSVLFDFDNDCAGRIYDEIVKAL